MSSLGFQRGRILWTESGIVKLQSKLKSSVQVGQEVDFVFPLSQQEQQEQPTTKSTRTKCTTDLTHKTMTSTTIPGMVTHHPVVGQPQSQLNKEFNSSAAQLVLFCHCIYVKINK